MNEGATRIIAAPRPREVPAIIAERGIGHAGDADIERLARRMTARIARIASGLSVAADDQDTPPAKIIAHAREHAEKPGVREFARARLTMLHQNGEAPTCFGANSPATVEKAHLH